MNHELIRRIEEKKERIKYIEGSSMMAKEKVLSEQKAKLKKLEEQLKAE
jgi:hypothetical protein